MIEVELFATAVRSALAASSTKQGFAKALFGAAQPLIKAVSPHSDADVRQLDALLVPALAAAGVDPYAAVGQFARARVREAAMLPWLVVSYSGGPIFADDWNGEDGEPWSAQNWGATDFSFGPSSVIDIQSNTGRISPAGAAFGNAGINARTNFVVKDFELTAQFTLNPPDGGDHNIYFRSSTGLSYGIQNGYRVQIAPGGQKVRLDRYDNWNKTTLVSADKTYNTSPWYLKLRTQGSSFKIRVWQGNEPSTWDIDTTDATYASGRMNFASYCGAAGTATPIYWDNLRITAL